MFISLLGLFVLPQNIFVLLVYYLVKFDFQGGKDFFQILPVEFKSLKHYLTIKEKPVMDKDIWNIVVNMP